MDSCVPCSRPSSNGCRLCSPSGARLRTAIGIIILCAVLALAFASGCTRTVLVSESSPIRTGPCVKGRVYVKTADGWQLGDNQVTIPEGWYCVPPSYVEEGK